MKGARYQGQDREGRCTYLGRGVVDDLLGGQIALVADEKLVDILSGVTVDLLEPLLDVREGLLWWNTTEK